MADDVVIEANVVSNKNAVFGELDDVACNFVEFRRAFDHFIRNTGEADNEFRDGAFRVEQGDVLADDFTAIGFIHGNFRNLT